MPRYEPMIVRASPVMVSGEISAVCSGEGSPAVTVLPPGDVALNAVVKAAGWPAHSTAWVV